MTDNIPRDIKFKISTKLGVEDILNLCLTSKNWSKVCNDDSLLNMKISARYRFFVQSTKTDNINVLAWYQTLFSHSVFPLTKNGDNILLAASKLNNSKLLDYALGLDTDVNYMSDVLDKAIK